MENLKQVKHLSVAIRRDWKEANEFLSNPESFPKWASGLGDLNKTDDSWLANTPDGKMKVRFSEFNEFGVLDHWLSPTSDVTIYIPLRLIPNECGCELILTLFRKPGMSDEKFSDDADWVVKDLKAAKELLEQK